MRVPLGVIGIIYESRPNVTVDAAALCLKAGNAAILRGGSEALHSNQPLPLVSSKGWPPPDYRQIRCKRLKPQIGQPSASLVLFWPNTQRCAGATRRQELD